MGKGSKDNFAGSAWARALYSAPPLAAEVTEARECQGDGETQELCDAAVLGLQGASPALALVSLKDFTHTFIALRLTQA